MRSEQNITLVENYIFKLSILTLCTIVGNVYWVLLLVFYEDSYSLPKAWIIVDVIVILILGGLLLNKLKLVQIILAGGFITFLLFPLLWKILPAKIPQEYIGMRKTEQDGFILADEYCNNDCDIVDHLFQQGYYEERKFYSWRYAELLGRFPSESSCCYNQPFDSKFLFGLLILMELTFEYFPLIFLISFIMVMAEHFRRKDLGLLGLNFTEVAFKIKRLNVVGSALITAITIYNLIYMNSI